MARHRSDVDFRRLRFNASDSSGDEEEEKDGDRLPVALHPPLRSTENLLSPPTVGTEPRLLPRPIDHRFADVLFWIKVDPFPPGATPRDVARSAFDRAGLVAKMDLAAESHRSGWTLQLFVEEALVSRGRGESPLEAEMEAYQDFVERAITSDFLRVESKFSVASKTVRTKLKLFESEAETVTAGCTAFRYDLLCSDHEVEPYRVPRCVCCRETGHNRFFCKTKPHSGSFVWPISAPQFSENVRSSTARLAEDISRLRKEAERTRGGLLSNESIRGESEKRKDRVGHSFAGAMEQYRTIEGSSSSSMEREMGKRNREKIDVEERWYLGSGKEVMKKGFNFQTNQMDMGRETEREQFGNMEKVRTLEVGNKRHRDFGDQQKILTTDQGREPEKFSNSVRDDKFHLSSDRDRKKQVNKKRDGNAPFVGKRPHNFQSTRYRDGKVQLIGDGERRVVLTKDWYDKGQSQSENNFVKDDDYWDDDDDGIDNNFQYEDYDTQVQARNKAYNSNYFIKKGSDFKKEYQNSFQTPKNISAKKEHVQLDRQDQASYESKTKYQKFNQKPKGNHRFKTNKHTQPSSERVADFTSNRDSALWKNKQNQMKSIQNPPPTYLHGQKEHHRESIPSLSNKRTPLSSDRDKVSPRNNKRICLPAEQGRDSFHRNQAVTTSVKNDLARNDCVLFQSQPNKRKLFSVSDTPSFNKQCRSKKKDSESYKGPQKFAVRPLLPLPPLLSHQPAVQPPNNPLFTPALGCGPYKSEIIQGPTIIPFRPKAPIPSLLRLPLPSPVTQGHSLLSKPSFNQPRSSCLNERPDFHHKSEAKALSKIASTGCKGLTEKIGWIARCHGQRESVVLLSTVLELIPSKLVRRRVAFAASRVLEDEARVRFVRTVAHRRLVFGSLVKTYHEFRIDYDFCAIVDDLQREFQSPRDFAAVTDPVILSLDLDTILRTVETLARIWDWPPKKLQTFLRDKPEFPDNYMDEDEMGRLFTPEKMEGLVRRLCRLRGVAAPLRSEGGVAGIKNRLRKIKKAKEENQKVKEDESIKLKTAGRAESEMTKNISRAKKALGKMTTAFGSGFCETDDFLRILEVLASRETLGPKELVEMLTPIFRGAACYLAEFHGLNIPKSQESSLPNFVDFECNDNHRLHTLVDDVERLVVADSSCLEKFAVSLRASDHLAIHSTWTHFRSEAHSPALLTTRTDDLAAILLIDIVEPNFVRDFFKTIEREWRGKRILSYRPVGWNLDLDVVEIVDLQYVEPTAWKRNFSFVNYSKILTGGPLCPRASYFTGSITPSNEALRHALIRVSLLHRFAQLNGRVVANAIPLPKDYSALEKHVEEWEKLKQEREKRISIKEKVKLKLRQLKRDLVLKRNKTMINEETRAKSDNDKVKLGEKTEMMTENKEGKRMNLKVKRVVGEMLYGVDSVEKIMEDEINSERKNEQSRQNAKKMKASKTLRQIETTVRTEEKGKIQPKATENEKESKVIQEKHKIDNKNKMVEVEKTQEIDLEVDSKHVLVRNAETDISALQNTEVIIKKQSEGQSMFQLEETNEISSSKEIFQIEQENELKNGTTTTTTVNTTETEKTPKMDEIKDSNEKISQAEEDETGERDDREEMDKVCEEEDLKTTRAKTSKMPIKGKRRRKAKKRW